MTMETALRSRLLDDGPLSSLVGSNIDWTVRPERSTYPAVVLQVIGDDRSQHMRGFNGFRQTNVQIDCFAIDRSSVVDIRDAVIAAVVPSGEKDGVTFLRSFIRNVIDLGANSETGFVHRDSIDFTIWHDA